MLIKNVKVFTEDKKFKNGAIVLEDKIKAVYTEANMPDSDLEETIDGNGAYAIPGLIDLHFHGCKGDDFCDGTKEAIARIAEYEASIGVTAIAPATMTLPVEELEHILEVVAEYKKKIQTSAELIYLALIWRDHLSVLPKKVHRMKEILSHVMWKFASGF